MGEENSIYVLFRLSVAALSKQHNMEQQRDYRCIEYSYNTTQTQTNSHFSRGRFGIGLRRYVFVCQILKKWGR